MNARLIGALAIALLVIAGAAAFFLLRSRDASGPIVARDNPCDVFPSLDGALADWMRDQRKFEPALTCEHFERLADSTPTVSQATRWEDASNARTGAPERWYGPSGRQLLLPLADRLSLVDLQTSTQRLLLQAAGGQSWTDAGWMDERSFVVAGRAVGAVPGTTAPTLTVFRLDDNVISVYRGPSTPAP